LDKNRLVRYQGAIIKDDRILLIRWREIETERTFWLFPGGGREAGESVQECIVREMREETNLEVEVDNKLLEERSHEGAQHTTTVTYLCHVSSGVASAGHEPEDPQPDGYGIVEVGWFDLPDEMSWGDLLRNDPITYPQLRKLRSILGYAGLSSVSSNQKPTA
jgi:8-oxo-dGTP pyrophosphatase MutT (NUDIX family)